MTIEEITERILEAAAIERRMPREKHGPKAGRGYVLPWVHEETDIKQWRKEIGDKLLKEDADQLNRDWRWKWLHEERPQPPTLAEINRWQEVREWFRSRLTDPKERRALWAWAWSKAGGKSFASFCRGEGIHVMTGSRRKNRAIDRISGSFGSKPVQHSENVPSAVLMDEAEIIYFSDTFEADAFEAQQPLRYTWRDDPSMKPLFEHGRRSSRRRRVAA